MSDEARITALARSFPALRGAPGLEPWDALALADWAMGPASSGQRWAALFVLAVWNRYDWGRSFDLVAALCTWDEEHWQAFRTWAANPFTC